MGLLSRFVEVFQAQMHKLLNRVEDPAATLDLSYEKMVASLQDTKKHLADVVAEQRSLMRQIEATQKSIDGSENDARTALQAGREDLAKGALAEKQASVTKLESLNNAYQTITPQVDKLVTYEKTLEARIEQFASQKEVMKSNYAAAKAQVAVTESLTGIGDKLGGVGDAMRRANDKVDGMRNKADALEGLMAAGVLADPLDSRSQTQKELGQLKSDNAITSDLERLKAEMGKVTDGTKDEK